VLTMPWAIGIFDVSSTQGLAAATGEIERQAAMIGYINAFRLFTIISLIPIPLIWLARMPKQDAE